MNVFCGCAIAAHRIPQKLRFGSSGSLGVASNVCRSAGDFAISWHDITSTACCPAGDAQQKIFVQTFTTFPQPGCLWGSFSKERISVTVCRESSSPIMQERFPERAWYRDLGTKISAPDLGTRILVPISWYQDLVPRSWHQDLVPRSWYQDLGTRILVPRSWYQDHGTKFLHGAGLAVLCI